jgi:transcriptional regulator with XRE-family HTH domain
MSDSLPSIDLDLVTKLQDPNYRQAFFIAESSALIAKQLIELRKRRGLNQTQVAAALATGQPVISRVERSDYRNWSFNTLRRLAEAMDARLRVYIEPSEDVLNEYKVEEDGDTLVASAALERAEPLQKTDQSEARFLSGSAAGVNLIRRQHLGDRGLVG